MEVDDKPSGDKNERGGLYSLEALVLPVALRFKFHFDSQRPTSRLDKVSPNLQPMRTLFITMYFSRSGTSLIF